MKDVKEIKTKTGKINLEAEYLKAKKEPNFVKIITKLDIDDKELMKYTSKLMQCANELDNYGHKEDKTYSYNEVSGFILTPYVVDGVLNFKYVACKEKEEELEAAEFIKNGYRFEVSKDIRCAKMKDIYTDDKNRVPIIKWMTSFIKDYKAGKKVKGLYLSGNFGCGKSYLVSAMLNELVKDGHTAAMIYYPEFLRILKSSFKTDFDEQYDYARKVELLLFDDIGAENITSWSRDEILGPILQYRMNNNLPTFFTSNLNMKELEIHLSESKNEVDKLKAKRIIERIKFLTEELTLISENKRK
jgi:primosomal protein DnaI